LTPDPIGLNGGINLYSYVFNNSINLTDPLGLFYPFGGPGFVNVMPSKPPSWAEQSNSYPSPVRGVGEGVNVHNAIPGQFAILGPAAIIEAGSYIQRGLISPISYLIQYGTPPQIIFPDLIEELMRPTNAEAAEASQCPN
jgi:hypothetical protein